jgi:hypothetical protein
VPAEFVDVFYTMTKNNYDLGLLALGIAEVESEWRYMASRYPNSNGSVDLGPLGLNSRNLADPDFMRRFASPEYADHDPNIYCMTTCINLIRGLYYEYGDAHTALKVYNGGIHAVSTSERWDALSQITSLYANRVLRHCQSIEDRWDQYFNENSADPRTQAEVLGELKIARRREDTGPAVVQEFALPQCIRQRNRDHILYSVSLPRNSFSPGEQQFRDSASIIPQTQKITRNPKVFVYFWHYESTGHARDGPESLGLGKPLFYVFKGGLAGLLPEPGHQFPVGFVGVLFQGGDGAVKSVHVVISARIEDGRKEGRGGGGPDRLFDRRV